ncbi:MAG: hypothetical protein WCW67_04260 [Candidatus Margulisiibacteriota bacterium]|jgi:hypothetical protein
MLVRFKPLDKWKAPLWVYPEKDGRKPTDQENPVASIEEVYIGIPMHMDPERAEAMEKYAHRLPNV